MSLAATARQAQLKAKTSKGNEFHNIRNRELRREQECLKGAPTSSIPAYFTPSLKEICAKTIAETFERQEKVDALKDDPDTYELYRLVIDQLSTDLKLEEAVRRVNEQEYWRACCEARWSVGQLAEFTKQKGGDLPAGGWKQVYLQRHLEEFLMGIDCNPGQPIGVGGGGGSVNTSAPTTVSLLLGGVGSTNNTSRGGNSPLQLNQEDDPAEAISHHIVHLCTTCSNWIRSLHLTHQGYHFNVELLVSKLPGLEELSLTYGVLNAGIAFRVDMLKMRQPDAMWLQAMLRSTNSLHTLSLVGNGIDGDLIRALVAGLINNNKITSLDLSSNRIDDNGANALGTLLMKKGYQLKTLKLNDNVIREGGARALGRALTINTKLQELNLKLNRLGDMGGQFVIDGLRTNGSLTSLNLGNNDLSAESARAFGEALRMNKTLLDLDVAGNILEEDGGRVLLSAVENNSGLLSVDVRRSGVDPRDEEALKNMLLKRTANLQKQSLDVVEQDMRARIQKNVAEKIYRTHGVASAI